MILKDTCNLFVSDVIAILEAIFFQGLQFLILREFEKKFASILTFEKCMWKTCFLLFLYETVSKNFHSLVLFDGHLAYFHARNYQKYE